MQNITKSEIQELLSIIPKNYPSQDIYYLTNSCDLLSQELHYLCSSQNYQYDLMIPNCDNFEELHKESKLKPRKFYYEKNRYNLHSRVYDFVFISVDLESVENIESFYKKIYAISKNGGKVIYLLDSSTDIQKFSETLIEYNYVAVNPLEDTFKNCKIVTANKMHGWDN